MGRLTKDPQLGGTWTLEPERPTSKSLPVPAPPFMWWFHFCWRVASLVLNILDSLVYVYSVKRQVSKSVLVFSLRISPQLTLNKSQKQCLINFSEANAMTQSFCKLPPVVRDVIISNTCLCMCVSEWSPHATSASLNNRGVSFSRVSLFAPFDSQLQWPDRSKYEKFGVLLTEWIWGRWRLSSLSHTELSLRQN